MVSQIFYTAKAPPVRKRANMWLQLKKAKDIKVVPSSPVQNSSEESDAILPHARSRPTMVDKAEKDDTSHACRPI